MVELATVIAALRAYRARLKASGKLLKAMAVVVSSFVLIGHPFPGKRRN